MLSDRNMLQKWLSEEKDNKKRAYTYFGQWSYAKVAQEAQIRKSIH